MINHDKCGPWEAEIADLKEDIKFLLSFAPKHEVPQGLPAMYYLTLSYQGDKDLWSRIECIKQKVTI